MLGTYLRLSTAIMLLYFIQRGLSSQNYIESQQFPNKCSPKQIIAPNYFMVVDSSLIHTTNSEDKQTNVYFWVQKSSDGTCLNDLYGECLVYEGTREIPIGIYQLAYEYHSVDGSSTITESFFAIPSTNALKTDSWTMNNGDIGFRKVFLEFKSPLKLKFALCDDYEQDYSYVGGFQLLQGKTIDGCLDYNNDLKCITCQSDRTLSNSGYCNSKIVIVGCQNQSYTGSLTRCTACYLNYVLTQIGTCLPKIDYCSVYSAQGCKTCITGYLWNGHVCAKQQNNCLVYSENGDCASCLEGFIPVKGLCSISPQSPSNSTGIPACPKGFYLNQNGSCLLGLAKFCTEYSSPFGTCLKCETAYQIKENQCRIVCPANTSSEKYFIQNGKCIKTNAFCTLTNEDGYCSVCESGFYAFQCQCYRIVENSNLRSDKQIEGTTIINEKGSVYLANPNGSRIYLQGPWKGQEVWTDVNGWLYEKLHNEIKLYLNGPLANQKIFVDSQGKEFFINAEGKKIFI